MAKMSFLSTYLKEIVYGGNDGIVTTFAIVAGFAGAQSQSTTIPLLSVLLFGFANLFADGVSMALGNFLSSRSEKDVYAQQKQQELSQMQSDPKSEEEETRTILKHKGFSPEQAETLLSIYKTNRPYWLSFMMNDELEMANPEKENAFTMSLTTFFSFVVFGLIPLLPYVLFRNSALVFQFSLTTTAMALLALGLLRWRVTRQKLTRSLFETLLLGGLAALIAYGVGTLFRI
jgi:vacuolar iron transporter family protein